MTEDTWAVVKDIAKKELCNKRLFVVDAFCGANNVLMIRSYFNTSIPDALFEAAKIDGAGHMKIFTSITLPLGKPILVTMGLFSALGYWNDWTNGLYYLSGNEGQKLYSIQNLLNQITHPRYLRHACANRCG